MEQIHDLLDWFTLHHTLLARCLSVKSSIPVTVLSAPILVIAGTFLVLYIITIKELQTIFIPNKSLAIASFRSSSIISEI
jgi:hypothetical protein